METLFTIELHWKKKNQIQIILMNNFLKSYLFSYLIIIPKQAIEYTFLAVN